MTDFLPIKDHNSITKDILSHYAALRKDAGYDYAADLNDSQTAIAEAVAYRLLLQNAFYNRAFEDLLTLDNISDQARLNRVIELVYGVKRLAGVYPSAPFKLKNGPQTLSLNQGTKLSDQAGNQALLTEDVILSADEEKIAFFELAEYVATSKLKFNQPPAGLAGLTITQLDDFKGGAQGETNSNYLERARISRSASATAGAKEAYIYHTRSVDPRIGQVAVISNEENPYQITVYFQADLAIADAEDKEAVMTKIAEKITQRLNEPKIKPLSDAVTVRPAEIVAL